MRSLLTLRKERRSGVLSVTTEGVRTFVYLDQGTPVFAEEGVLDEAARPPDEGAPEAIVEQFKEFIDQVNPDDFAS